MPKDLGHNSRITVDIDDLTAILSTLDNTQQSITEATGRHRAKIKEILEEQAWNKGALATIRKIHAMSPTARADFIRTFDPLFKCMMTAIWDDELDDMLADLEAEEADENEDDDDIEIDDEIPDLPE